MNHQKMPTHSLRRIIAILVFLASSCLAYSQTPTQITLCNLKKDPGAYNHKVIELTTFTSQGFEDFTLFDPTCPDWPQIWVEYGGLVKSGTLYCCGVSADREHDKPQVIEDIPVTLVEDDTFHTFNKQLHRHVRESALVHATLIGRFFAGRLERYGNGPAEWRGYGHMGCCSLFVVQQVTHVDDQTHSDLDYDHYATWPYAEKSKVGCGYSEITPLDPAQQLLDFQKSAEEGAEPSAFDQPDIVAVEQLKKIAKLTTEPDLKFDSVNSTSARRVYTWQPKKKAPRYSVILSRPYWLSFYAKDSNHVAWVPLAVYRESCDGGDTVQRIR
jgi:hypothetical protein